MQISTYWKMTMDGKSSSGLCFMGWGCRPVVYLLRGMTPGAANTSQMVLVPFCFVSLSQST